MKTRISGKEAARVAEDMAKPGPIRVVAASEAQEAPGALVRTYAGTHLELALGEAPIDIVAKGFDAGIGPHVGRHDCRSGAGLMKIAVVGARTYFARRRPPRTPDDLARHSCIQYRMQADGDVLMWLAVRAQPQIAADFRG